MLALGIIEQLDTHQHELWLCSVVESFEPQAQEQLALDQYRMTRPHPHVFRLLCLQPLPPTDTPLLINSVASVASVADNSLRWEHYSALPPTEPTEGEE